MNAPTSALNSGTKVGIHLGHDRAAMHSGRATASANNPGASMPALQINHRSHEDGTVLVLNGEIDISTEDEFHRAVIDAARECKHGRVVLDCANLAFIDSSGLRVLIQSNKAGKEHDSRLLIAAPSERVAQILRVTGIDTRIPVFPTVEAALNAPVETTGTG
ncbi:STAS domain-containing protein [Salinactinospora qingdaonensis]